MSYCIKCGKLIDDYSLICENCTTSDSPWLLALKNETAELSKQIMRLKAENAALRARLEKAVELPAKVMIERTIVKGKFKPTQKAQAFNGRIGVVYRDETRYKGLLVDICSEKVYDYEAADARLKEIKEEI